MTRRPKLWKVWTCAAERSPLSRLRISSAALRVECQHQYVAWGNALVANEVGDLPDDGRGLARSRARKHEGRILVASDGFSLFVRERDPQHL